MKHLSHFNEFLNESVTKTFIDLVHENTHELDDVVYHGTPVHNLYSILKEGIQGSRHGELNEEDTVSTSLNSEMISQFSYKHKVGLEYDLSGFKVFIMPDWLRAILDTDSGARTYDDYEEDELLSNCREYNMALNPDGEETVSLPDDFLENNLPNEYIGAVYEYTLKRDYGIRDEAEIIIIGHGIEMLNKQLICVHVGKEFFYDVDEAIEYLEETFEESELRDPERQFESVSLNEKYYAGQVFAEVNPVHKRNLDKAKELAEEGASEDDIRDATNWFRGKYDNKWRIEMEDRIDFTSIEFEKIYDKGVKCDLYHTVTTLADVCRDNDFFKAYPTLANMQVELVYGDNCGIDAYFMPDSPTSYPCIYVMCPSIDEVKTHLVHELQHAIQSAEDFARGGSPDTFRNGEKGRMRSLKDRTDMYMGLAGEIEARDVQARTNYSPEQRKHIKPFSTEDFPKDAAHITYKD